MNTTPNLFAAEPPKATSYVLWYRKNRLQPWERMATASTTQELVAVMSQGPSGEYSDLAVGKVPEGRRA